MGLINIVIPTHNGAKTIGRTIQSVLNQTFDDWSLYIIDNASEDNTREIVTAFNDSRIQLIKNPSNIGFEGNWNKALKYSTSKYFKLLPDDDLLHSEALARAIQVLEDKNDVVLVGSRRLIIDENDRGQLVRGYGKLVGKKVSKKDFIKALVHYASNPIGEPGSTVVRSSAIGKSFKFNMSIPLFIDVDFYLHVLESGHLYYMNDVLYKFRVWSRSYSVANEKKQKEDYTAFYDKTFTENEFLHSYDRLIYNINFSKNHLLKKFYYSFTRLLSK